MLHESGHEAKQQPATKRNHLAARDGEVIATNQTGSAKAEEVGRMIPAEYRPDNVDVVKTRPVVAIIDYSESTGIDCRKLPLVDGKYYWRHEDKEFLVKPPPGWDGWWQQFQFASIRKAMEPDDFDVAARLEPHTSEEWTKLLFALSDIADDSQSPEELDEFINNTSEPDLWHGLVPRGCITLLAGDAKVGKSTLIRGLLHTSAAAAPATFLGRAVEKFGAFIISEDPARAWANSPRNIRTQRHDSGPITDLGEWRAMVHSLDALAFHHRKQLLVIDNWSKVCGLGENESVATNQAIAPLRELAEVGQTIVLVHHFNARGDIRGSTSLAAAVDSVLKLTRPSDDVTDPRRTLECVSRVAPASRIEYELRDGTLQLQAAKTEAASHTVSAEKKTVSLSFPLRPRGTGA